jgi:hypothetical protein
MWRQSIHNVALGWSATGHASSARMTCSVVHLIHLAHCILINAITLRLGTMHSGQLVHATLDHT